MGYLAVVLAAAAAFALGGAWYGRFGDAWMRATGLSDAERRAAGPWPMAVGVVAALLAAGMLRHVFVMSGLSGAVAGLVAGLGVGLFIVAPWIALHYAFARRGAALVAIDGGYAVAAFAAMGLVLGLFG